MMESLAPRASRRSRHIARYVCLLGAALCANALGGCATGPRVPRAEHVAASAAGVYLDPEIAAGYKQYRAELEPFGVFEADSRYGVRFCPSVAPGAAAYQPYVADGSWRASAPDGSAALARSGGAPVPGSAQADSPYWVADDGDRMAEITAHHGWWVHHESNASWCWVPGTEATPARVVWTQSGGVVGYAPTPPQFVAAIGLGNLIQDFTFLLLGALFDPSPLQYCLCEPDERALASQLAVDAVRERGVDKPPTSAVVAAARAVLAQYEATHFDAFRAARANQPATSPSKLHAGSTDLPALAAGTPLVAAATEAAHKSQHKEKAKSTSTDAAQFALAPATTFRVVISEFPMGMLSPYALRFVPFERAGAGPDGAQVAAGGARGAGAGRASAGDTPSGDAALSSADRASMAPRGASAGSAGFAGTRGGLASLAAPQDYAARAAATPSRSADARAADARAGSSTLATGAAAAPRQVWAATPPAYNYSAPAAAPVRTAAGSSASAHSSASSAGAVRSSSSSPSVKSAASTSVSAAHRARN